MSAARKLPTKATTPKPRVKPPQLTGVLKDLPEGLFQATRRVLTDMAQLTVPTSKTKPAALEAARLAAEGVHDEWVTLRQMATRVLGNGDRHGISVSQFKSAVWQTPSSKHYEAVWEFFRRSTPEAKEEKSRRDKRRYKLMQVGLWERWQANQAYEDAWEATCEAYARRDRFSREDRSRRVSALENAIIDVNRLGRWCRCGNNRLLDNHCFRPDCNAVTQLELHKVMEGLRETAEYRLKAGGYDDESFRYGAEPDEDEDEEVDFSPEPEEYDETREYWYGERSCAPEDDDDDDDPDEDDESDY